MAGDCFEVTEIGWQHRSVCRVFILKVTGPAGDLKETLNTH